MPVSASSTWHTIFMHTLKRLRYVQADFQGAMKLVNSADDRYLDAEQRLEECQRDIRRLEKEKQAAIIAVRLEDDYLY